MKGSHFVIRTVGASACGARALVRLAAPDPAWSRA
jgi:hypothetical protein